MSRFLAPIHTWVYNKIKIQEDLEQNVVNMLKNKFGDEIQSIDDQAKRTYGEPLGDSPIEEVIDTSNIHGWLQGRIDMVEPRMAYIIAGAVDKFGKEAEEEIQGAFRKHGENYGSNAEESFPVATAPELYKALNNYLLEGMPCDLVNVVAVSEPDKLQWNNTRCLHRGYWESVKANPDFMYELRFTWMRAFIEKANANFTYRVTKSEMNGESIFVNEIVAK
jgi:hypothetical protein